MADVTWVAEVEGHAAESFEAIAGAADHAGDEVEKFDRKTKEAGSSVDLGARAMSAGWALVGGVIAATAGTALALGAAFGGILAVGILALHGLDGGFGSLTSQAQAFRFESGVSKRTGKVTTS